MSALEWFGQFGGWVLSALLLVGIYLFNRWARRREAELDEQILEHVHAERWIAARKRGVGSPEVACPRCGAGTQRMCNMSR